MACLKSLHRKWFCDLIQISSAITRFRSGHRFTSSGHLPPPSICLRRDAPSIRDVDLTIQAPRAPGDHFRDERAGERPCVCGWCPELIQCQHVTSWVRDVEIRSSRSTFGQQSQHHVALCVPFTMTQTGVKGRNRPSHPSFKYIDSCRSH